VQFLLPDIGEGVAEGEIVKWHVQAGDTVTEEQDFVEVMTDKATVMIPCPVTGVLGDLLFAEGEVVPVHTAIASFTEVTEGKLAGAHGAPAPAPAPEPLAAAAAPATAAASPASSGSFSGLLDDPQEKVIATPATRKLARALGLEISRVPGSGKYGRILRTDVERIAQGGAPAPSNGKSAQTPSERRAAGAQAASAPVARPAAPATPMASAPAPRAIPVPPPAQGEVEERVPLRGVRRKIAEYLIHSKRTAAHYTYVEEVDVTELVKLRQRMKPMAEAQGVKLTYLSFITKAVAIALTRHKELNASLDDTTSELVFKKYYNIGIAADTDIGLVVPVVKAANRRSIIDIASEIVRLAQGARTGSLAPDDMTGGTFTITSAGHIGGLLATPILNYPEVGIMGVHKIKRRPVVVDEEIVIRDIMYLSLSLDHRVVDGANAARFMNTIVRFLENPERFILEGV
jgi:pyruvate/2-oxoglutarate dehydrogenase complex dihydrolipoamide acyltransferase (E2) component